MVDKKSSNEQTELLKKLVTGVEQVLKGKTKPFK